MTGLWLLMSSRIRPLIEIPSISGLSGGTQAG